MDQGVIQASDRLQMFGYTKREHYESIGVVSMETKQAGTAHSGYYSAKSDSVRNNEVNNNADIS